MKKTISLLALLSTLTLSQMAHAEKYAVNQVSAGAAFAATDIAITVYYPEAVLATSAIATLGFTSQLSDPRYNYKMLQTLINNDAQEFHTSGKLSAALSETIEAVKKGHTDFSDAEAVDFTVEAINQRVNDLN